MTSASAIATNAADLGANKAIQGLAIKPSAAGELPSAPRRYSGSTDRRGPGLLLRKLFSQGSTRCMPARIAPGMPACFGPIKTLVAACSDNDVPAVIRVEPDNASRAYSITLDAPLMAALPWTRRPCAIADELQRSAHRYFSAPVMESVRPGRELPPRHARQPVLRHRDDHSVLMPR